MVDIREIDVIFPLLLHVVKTKDCGQVVKLSSQLFFIDKGMRRSGYLSEILFQTWILTGFAQ
jgi:hypothetical protein